MTVSGKTGEKKRRGLRIGPCEKNCIMEKLKGSGKRQKDSEGKLRRTRKCGVTKGPEGSFRREWSVSGMTRTKKISLDLMTWSLKRDFPLKWQG